MSKSFLWKICFEKSNNSSLEKEPHSPKSGAGCAIDSWKTFKFSGWKETDRPGE